MHNSGDLPFGTKQAQGAYWRGSTSLSYERDLFQPCMSRSCWPSGICMYSLYHFKFKVCLFMMHLLTSANPSDISQNKDCIQFSHFPRLGLAQVNRLRCPYLLKFFKGIMELKRSLHGYYWLCAAVAKDGGFHCRAPHRALKAPWCIAEWRTGRESAPFLHSEAALPLAILPPA